MSRLYPRPDLRTLLDQVDAGRVYRDGAGISHLGGSHRRVTDEMAALAGAGWVADGERIPGRPVQWRVTDLGRAIQQVRIVPTEPDRHHAVTGPAPMSTYLGYTEKTSAGWIVQVGATVLHTTRSQAVAELFHHAALALAEQAAPAADVARLVDIRRLVAGYDGQVPPIFRDPGSEYGQGYVAGMQAMAAAVLAVLDGEAA